MVVGTGAEVPASCIGSNVGSSDGGAIGKGWTAVKDHFLLPALGPMVVVVGTGAVGKGWVAIRGRFLLWGQWWWWLGWRWLAKVGLL